MDKGVLYGVSVGPGETELLTLRALRVLNNCPVIAAPRTPGGGMVALDIIRPAVDVAGKTVIPLDFTMSHSAARRAACHQRAAEIVRQPLVQGLDVAVLNLGDVGLYASFPYLAALLGKEFPVERIPGVPSFCAAAAALGISLTEMNKPLHLLPGGEQEPGGKAPGGTRVYMKSGRQLGDLLESLERQIVLEKAFLVQNCGMDDERIFCGAAAKKAPHSYFSIVIVKE